MAELALGTVQFGLAYGATNTRGQVPEDEVARILGSARQAGVRFLDTASAYGTAEAVLGRTLPPGHDFRIVTKTPAWRADRDLHGNLAASEAALRDSLQALGVRRVDALLLHRGEDLLGEQGRTVWQWLTSVRERGLARRIGVSVYAPQEAELVLERFAIELVQMPGNLLDQRFLSSGALARLSARGVAVHLRSLFLQGLLLSPEALRKRGPTAARAATALDRCLDERRLSPLQACLGWGLAQSVEAVVLGVSGVEEWAAILQAASDAPRLDAPELACEDLDLIDPRRWQH